MKKRRFFLILLLHCALAQSYQDETPLQITPYLSDFQKEMEYIEELFTATAYAKALEDLKIATQKLPAEDRRLKHIYYLMGLAYLHNNNLDEAIATLEASQAGYEDVPYWLAVAMMRSGKKEQAIPLFLDYLNHTKLSLYESDAKNYLGICYFDLKHYAKCKPLFISLLDATFLCRAHCYLAHLYIIEADYASAEELLNSKLIIPPQHNPLFYEWHYLLGELHFKQHHYIQAIEAFEKVYPLRNSERTTWRTDTLYYLGWSYLKCAVEGMISSSAQKMHFDKAEKIVKQLYEETRDERSLLSLAHYFITYGKTYQNIPSLQKAEQLLSDTTVLTSREGNMVATLLKTEASTSYHVREKWYRQLTNIPQKDRDFLARCWYFRGINDFEEGCLLTLHNHDREAAPYFSKAQKSLGKAFQLLDSLHPRLAVDALKYQSIAEFYQHYSDGALSTFSTMRDMLESSLLFECENPDELYYLFALLTAHHYKGNPHSPHIELAITLIQRALQHYPQGKFHDNILYLLGMLHYSSKQYAQAQSFFLQLHHHHPTSELAGEALYWAARCGHSLHQEHETIRSLFTRVYEQYPHSPYAATACFEVYDYHDYVQGNRAAIKHLQNFQEKFPTNPLNLHALYLMGIDFTRDRKSPEGKWIRKKNYNTAIATFEELEATFDALYVKGLLPDDHLSSLIPMRYRAEYERGLAYLAIAKESQGAKQHIYFEYAEETFKHIIDHLPKELPLLHEESAYWLAKTYVLTHSDIAAESVITMMLEKYRENKTTRGYYLSRIWYEQSCIAMRQKEWQLALKYLEHSEEAAKGNILSIDEKLDLWIQQSTCYCALNELDQAMLTLSRVINEDAISALRLKAMYLRSEIYEKQGRFELARKQLEAMSLKGGEWGQKALAKLEKDHGYD